MRETVEGKAAIDKRRGRPPTGRLDVGVALCHEASVAMHARGVCEHGGSRGVKQNKESCAVLFDRVLMGCNIGLNAGRWRFRGEVGAQEVSYERNEVSQTRIPRRERIRDDQNSRSPGREWMESPRVPRTGASNPTIFAIGIETELLCRRVVVGCGRKYLYSSCRKKPLVTSHGRKHSNPRTLTSLVSHLSFLPTMTIAVAILQPGFCFSVGAA